MAVSAGLLYLVCHKISPHLIVETFHSVRWIWFLAAVALYGILFLPAAVRWHLVLRLTGNSAGADATARLTLIGHFFYTVLFGSVGGDSAKALFYSRWYSFPLAEVLATAPLDRLLGFLGMIVFAIGAFALGAATGGLSAMGRIGFAKPGLPWLAVGIVLAMGMIIWRCRAAKESLLAKFIQAFRAGIRSLARARGSALLGAFCGFLVQAALCGVVALNLLAMTHQPLPWAKLLWTLPLIVAIGALPISIGGLGTREGACMFLLGMYGVPESTAVAASFLTLAAILFWALAGGLLFIKEASLRPVAGKEPVHFAKA